MSRASTNREPLLDRFKWLILLGVGLLIVAAFAYLLLQEDDPVTITIQPPPPTATHTPTLTPAPLEIYVTGAVNRPESRHALPTGSRVEDAIAVAGGAAANADLSAVNLAQPLRDGDLVHVPVRAAAAFVDQESESVPATLPSTPTPNAPRPINLNTATQAELETLPGIGPAKAQAIIEYRTANGPFTSVEQITDISGIGPATLEDLRPFVAVE